MRAGLCYLRQYCFFHYLRNMGPDHYRSNLVQGYRSFGRCLLQRYHPSYVQVLRDGSSIKGVHNFYRYFVAQEFTRLQDVTVKTVRPKSLVEVRALYCIHYIRQFKGSRGGVDLHSIFYLLLHFFILLLYCSQVFWSFVYFFKVLGYCLLYKGSILYGLFIAFCTFSQLPDHRVIGPDHEDSISNLIELLHIASSQQVSQLFHVKPSVELLRYCQLLLLIEYLRSGPVSNNFKGELLLMLQLVLLPLQLIQFYLVVEVLISGSCNRASLFQHAIYRFLLIGKSSQDCLWHEVFEVIFANYRSLPDAVHVPHLYRRGALL